MSRAQRPYKKVNPNYFVFCEGETEKEYVEFLKREFRLPTLEIKSKVSGTAINERLIKRTLNEYETHASDLVFLMYDLDRPDINSKLYAINDTIVVGTLPSIELWFLLHFEEVRNNLTSTEALRKLRRHWSQYQKGSLSTSEQNDLRHYLSVAKENRLTLLSKGLSMKTDIPLFIEKLEEVKLSS